MSRDGHSNGCGTRRANSATRQYKQRPIHDHLTYVEETCSTVKVSYTVGAVDKDAVALCVEVQCV